MKLLNQKIILFVALISSASCGSFNPLSSNSSADSKEIGPDEEVITSSDGKLTLLIPTGALTEPVTIGIEKRSAESLGPEFQDVIDELEISAVYELTPDGIQFERPVTVTMISNQQVQVNDESISVSPEFLFSSSNGTLEYLPNQGMVVKNKSDIHIYGHLYHFSPIVRSNKSQDIGASVTSIKDEQISRTNTINIRADLKAKTSIISDANLSETHSGPIKIKGINPGRTISLSESGLISDIDVPEQLPIQESMDFNYKFTGRGEAFLSTNVHIQNLDIPHIDVLSPAYNISFQNTYQNNTPVETTDPGFTFYISNFDSSPSGFFPGQEVFNTQFKVGINDGTQQIQSEDVTTGDIDFPDGYGLNLTYDWGDGKSHDFKVSYKNDQWQINALNENWSNEYSINYSESDNSLNVRLEYDYENAGTYKAKAEVAPPGGIMHDFTNFRNSNSFYDTIENPDNLFFNEFIIGTSSSQILSTGGSLFSPDQRFSVSFDAGVFDNPQFISIQEVDLGKILGIEQIPVKGYNLTFENTDLLKTSFISKGEGIIGAEGRTWWGGPTNPESFNPTFLNQQVEFHDDIKSDFSEFEITLPLNQPYFFQGPNKPIILNNEFNFDFSEQNEPIGILFSDLFFSHRFFESAETTVNIPGHTLTIDQAGDGYGRTFGRDITQQRESFQRRDNDDVRWTVSNEIDNENLENFFDSQERNVFDCRDYCDHTFLANSTIEFLPIADPGNQFEGFLNNNLQKDENGTYTITLDRDMTVSPVFNFTNDDAITGGIEGFITHKESQLPGTLLTLKNPKNENEYTRVSGLDGHYKFMNIPEGNSQISVYLEGFICPVDQPITIEAEETTRADFECTLPENDDEEEQTEDQQVASDEPVKDLPEEPNPQPNSNTDWDFNIETFRVGFDLGYETRYNLKDEACNQEELDRCEAANGSPSFGLFAEIDAINNLKLPGTNTDLSIAMGFRSKRSSTDFRQMYNQGSGYPYMVDGSLNFTSAGFYSRFSAPIKDGFPMEDSEFEASFNIGFNYTWNKVEFKNQSFSSGDEVERESRSHQNLNFTTGAGVNVNWNQKIGTGLGVYWGTDGGGADALGGIRASINYNF